MNHQRKKPEAVRISQEMSHGPSSSGYIATYDELLRLAQYRIGVQIRVHPLAQDECFARCSVFDKANLRWNSIISISPLGMASAKNVTQAMVKDEEPNCDWMAAFKTDRDELIRQITAILL